MDELRRERRISIVGKSKLDMFKGSDCLPKVSLGSASCPPGSTGTLLDFKLGDYPEAMPQVFNVLYVRSPIPDILYTPLVRSLIDTVNETIALVRPVLRFGLPASSVRNKCKYWRDDESFLPTTPSLGMQKMFKEVRSGGIFTHTPHIPRTKVYTHEMPAWGVLALNVMAMVYITSNSMRTM